MLLATKGLPANSPSGLDIMNAMPLGASRAVEGERIRGSQEADIAATIQQIDAIESARVHLALGEPSAFVRDRIEPQASVMIRLKAGRALGDGEVQAIADLVAASVPGLAVGNVTIVDQRGQQLSRMAGVNGGALGQQLALRQRMEGDLQRRVVALLTPVLGDGNFSTEVNADLDFSEVQSTRDSAPANPAVLESEQSQMSSEGDAAAAAGGIPGTLSNTPPPAATVSGTPPGAAPASAAPASAAGRRTENVARHFVVGRETSVTRAQSPTLKRITVAIALRSGPGNRARGAREIQALQRLVQGAVGFDAARGDVIEITARPFVQAAGVTTAFYESEWFALVARNAAAVIVCLILVFGLFWPLYKRHQKKRENLAALDVLNQFNAQQAGRTEPGASGDGITIGMIEATQGYEARAAMIRAFVRQDPTRAALVVRDLIKANVSEGNEVHG